MAVYYLKGTSNSGSSAGLLGYYYPLYTDPSLITGNYHTHTFSGLADVTFYMPMGEANHAMPNSPTGSYGGEAYQEYATYVGTDDIIYNDVPDAPTQVISLATYSRQQARSQNARINNVESTRVEELIPIQLRESSEALINILSEYYDYMNSVDQSSNIFNRITSEQDIDETSSGYLDRIRTEVAKSVPEAKTFDKVSLYKKVIDYYSIRGSEDSVLVFFRIFFDELVDVFYPKDFLLKPSDGDWSNNDNILNFSDHIIADTSTDSKFSELNINDSITFRNSSDTQIGTGQITRIEDRTSTATSHPVINEHIIELNATEDDRFDVNTGGANPTFQPYSPFKGENTQAVAQLLNDVNYSNTDGFILDDVHQEGDPGLSNNYIDLGDVYASEEVSHGDEFTMIARIRSDGVVRGSVMKIFHSQGQAYPKHEINLAHSKIGSYIYKWGAYGYISQRTKGTTVIQQDTWTTVALRCKRDPNATAAAGGNGYMDVSVNGETWERIWDDSVYGTPTTFDLDYVAVNTRAAIPEADRWTFNANGLSIDANDSTYNGKPLYTGTLEKIGTGTDAYITDGGECTLRFESTETAYLNLGLISNNPNDFRPFNSLPSKLYGVWVLYSDHLSSPTDTDASRMENAAMVMWFDGGDTVEYQKVGTTQTGQNNNVETHLPHKMVPTHLQNRIGDPDDDDFDLLHSYRGHGAYHFGPTNTAAERGPNESGAARLDFFGVLKDYNRQLSANPNGLVNGQYIYVHPRDQIRVNRKPFYYKEYKGNGYSGRTTASQGGVNYEPVFNNSDKELTWFTSKRLFDISDATGTHKHLKLGVHRTHGYFKGDILHASYYNRALTQDELEEAHLYVSGLNNKRWGLRVNVDNDVSLSELSNIVDTPVGLNSSNYELTNLSSPLIDQFWTYDSDKYGSALTGFSATHSSTQTSIVNWGDGSIPDTAGSGIAISHNFGPTLAAEGNYNNRKGFVSDQNRIQDSDYWQEYSYEIRSGIQSVDWLNEYKKLVHPAGMKLFAALFLQIIRSNTWTGYTSYREGDPQREGQLSRWLEKLIPPWKRNDVSENGYHMPFYQPGWLTGDNRRIALLLEGLVNSGLNAKTGGGLFDRIVHLVMPFVFQSASSRNERVLEKQLGYYKFLDGNVRSGDYAYLTANELGSLEKQIIPKSASETNILSDVLPWGISDSSGDVGGDDQTYGITTEKSWVKVGNSNEVVRKYASDPFNKTSLVWQSINKDKRDTGGGYTSPYIPIDPADNKLYRFSVWAKHTGTEGGLNFGFRKREASTEEGDVRESDSILTTTTPTFFNKDLPTFNQWHLLVGYVRPTNQDELVNPLYNDAGVYNTFGEKVLDIDKEYVLDSDAIGLSNIAFTDAAGYAGETVEGGTFRYYRIVGADAEGNNYGADDDNTLYILNILFTDPAGNRWPQNPFPESMPSAESYTAEGVTVTAGYQRGTQNNDPRYDAYKSVDENLNTGYWNLGISDQTQNWIQYDLQGLRNIQQITIRSRQISRPTPRYNILASNDPTFTEFVQWGSITFNGNSPLSSQDSGHINVIRNLDVVVQSDGSHNGFIGEVEDVATGNNLHLNETITLNYDEGVIGASALVRDNIVFDGFYDVDNDSEDERIYDYSIDVSAGSSVTFAINATIVTGTPIMQISMFNPNDNSQWWANAANPYHIITSGSNILKWGPFDANVHLKFQIFIGSNDSLTIDSFTVDDTGDTSESAQNSLIVDDPVQIQGANEGDDITGTASLVYLGRDSDTDPSNPQNLFGHTINPLRAGSIVNFKINVTSIIGEGANNSMRTIFRDLNGNLLDVESITLQQGVNTMEVGSIGSPTTFDMIVEFVIGVDDDMIVEFSEFIVLDSADTSGEETQYQLWGPRIDVVDGNEPSITELIHPTIAPNIMYNINGRPTSNKVYKLNNFSVHLDGLNTQLDVSSVTSNDINYYNQLNYNENLKFLDSTDIGSYYNVKIEDMSNVEESGYVSTTQDSGTADALGNTSTYASDDSSSGGNGNQGGGY